MKLLFTGVNGFVGKNLSEYFRAFATVNGLTRAELDKVDPDSIMGHTALIHLAGKAHDLKNHSNPQEYFDVNFGKTKAIFDAFLRSDIKDFIYFSSVKAVADSLEDVLTEDVKPIPLTPYGKSKQQAEMYLLSKELPLNKRLFIMRPCMIHGPGNKGNLNLLYKVVQKGIPYPLAAFENQRSFLSIANLNFIINALISDPDIPGGVYNVADDCPLSTNEVIQIISTANGNKAKLWKINPSLIRLIAKIGDKLKLPLNTERLKKLTESYVVSNDKIKKALKIESLPVTSSQGLFTTIKSFTSA